MGTPARGCPPSRVANDGSFRFCTPFTRCRWMSCSSVRLHTIAVWRNTGPPSLRSEVQHRCCPCHCMAFRGGHALEVLSRCRVTFHVGHKHGCSLQSAEPQHPNAIGKCAVACECVCVRVCARVGVCVERETALQTHTHTCIRIYRHKQTHYTYIFIYNHRQA